MPTGMAKDQRYYALAAGLTSTQFNFSTTPGGSAVTVSSAGTGIYMYDASLSEGYNSATVVAYTTYYQASSYQLILEGQLAFSYAITGSSATLDTYAGNNYVRHVTASSASVKSNVLTINTTTYNGNGNGFSVGVVVSGPGIPAPGVTITKLGTGDRGHGHIQNHELSEYRRSNRCQGSGMSGPFHYKVAGVGCWNAGSSYTSLLL